jgi:hypothetical protein
MPQAERGVPFAPYSNPSLQDKFLYFASISRHNLHKMKKKKQIDNKWINPREVKQVKDSV